MGAAVSKRWNLFAAKFCVRSCVANRAYDADQAVVYASPVAALRGDESHSLAELEVFISKQLRQAEPYIVERNNLT